MKQQHVVQDQHELHPREREGGERAPEGLGPRGEQKFGTCRRGREGVVGIGRTKEELFPFSNSS